MADKKNKTGGKFKAFLRAVFVKNIDLKIFAVLFAVIVTLLVAGLGGKSDNRQAAIEMPPPSTSQFVEL